MKYHVLMTSLALIARVALGQINGKAGSQSQFSDARVVDTPNAAYRVSVAFVLLWTVWNRSRRIYA